MFPGLLGLAAILAGCGRMTASERPTTVPAVLAKYGPQTAAEFRPICRRLGIHYPPKRIYLLAFKRERILEVWGANARGPYARLTTFPILAASGQLGPKRREGDRQVPEGFYRITHLNPLSQYHLSLRVNYPNAEDIANATVPRNQLGGDIYVHGKNVSIGCIALGDSAIEKVFCLTALAGPSFRKILIAPKDFRTVDSSEVPADSEWVRNLYRRLHLALDQFPVARIR